MKINDAGMAPGKPGVFSRGWMVLLLLLSQLSFACHAAPCELNDYTIRVSGKDECLIMRKYGTDTPKTMLVWLHGDVSSGGPANYHFADAERAAWKFRDFETLSIAFVRPGYSDGFFRSSSVAAGHGGRRDHYTKVNMTEVASAIEKLQLHYKPAQTIVIGHSGGAATAANILGLFPDLLQGAVLVSCPCDLNDWRAGRRPWTASEDPAKWLPFIKTTVEVMALTGDGDANTPPLLAEQYVDKLIQHGVRAEFVLLTGIPHNGALESPEVLSAVGRMMMHLRQAVQPSQ